MSFLDGRAIRDWCRQRFQRKDDMLKTVETVTENTEEGKSVDALVIKKVFQSVSDGKALLASVITDKGVATDAGDTFAVMAGNIGKIESGGAGGSSPVRSPYEFVLNWNNFSVSATGSMDLMIHFPAQKLKRLVIKRMYLYMRRDSQANGLTFAVYGKKKGTETFSMLTSWRTSVSASGSSTNTGANITDTEIDLTEWDEVNYCKIIKSTQSGSYGQATVTLNFQAELYF